MSARNSTRIVPNECMQLQVYQLTCEPLCPASCFTLQLTKYVCVCRFFIVMRCVHVSACLSTRRIVLLDVIVVVLCLSHRLAHYSVLLHNSIYNVCVIVVTLATLYGPG